MPRKEPQLGFAFAVRQSRLAQGLSQEELANRANMHLTWISRVESGSANPSWGTTKRVARGLGLRHAVLAAMGEAKDAEFEECGEGSPGEGR